MRPFSLAFSIVLLGLGCRSPQRGAAPSERPSDLPIKAVETMRAGANALVAGYCLSEERSEAIGGPPETRSDWQLSDGLMAIWVTGARPLRCSEDSRKLLRVRGVVEIDTVTLLNGARVVRRYLSARSVL